MPRTSAACLLCLLSVVLGSTNYSNRNATFAWAGGITVSNWGDYAIYSPPTLPYQVI